VSKYPTLEGRFPQVAGISFGFDPRKLPGQRIDPRHVKVQGSFIELNTVGSFCLFFWITVSYLLFSNISANSLPQSVNKWEGQLHFQMLFVALSTVY